MCVYHMMSCDLCCVQVEELKRKFEEYRKDYEKRKEHIREEASRKSKALAEDNKHLQKYMTWLGV